MAGDERHSEAAEAEVARSPEALAQLEARNGLQQFDRVMEMVDYWLQPERPFRMRPSAILDLHRKALEGISSYAGNYRPSSVKIGGSRHEPIPAHLVPEEIERLCDYVNDNWHKSPIHLAAYSLWRLNWIHPFTDGNGRTSRALSYLVLCLRLGYRLPGTNSIPTQISQNKAPYYEVLEAADTAWAQGELDLSALEAMIDQLLARQLLSVHRSAKTDK